MTPQTAPPSSPCWRCLMPDNQLHLTQTHSHMSACDGHAATRAFSGSLKACCLGCCICLLPVVDVFSQPTRILCYLSSPGALSLCPFTGESVLSLLFLGVGAKRSTVSMQWAGVADVQQEMLAEKQILPGADSAVSTQLTEQCQHRVCCRCHCVLVLKRIAVCEGVMREAGWTFDWRASAGMCRCSAHSTTQLSKTQHWV